MHRNLKCHAAAIFGATFISALILLTGCKSKEEEKDRSPGNVPRGDRSSPGGDASACKSIEAIEILKDGNTVVSRLNQNTWIAWSLRNKKVKAKGLGLNYFAVNNDGSYLVSKISHTKYQLLELNQGNYRQKALIQISSSNTPSLHFSHDSRFLVIRHRPYNSGGLDQFDLYDIEKGTFHKSFRAAGIKFIKLADNGQSLLMGYDNGYEKFVTKYDLDTFNEYFRVRLPSYRSFSYMDVTKNSFVVKSRNTYYVHDLNSGELLYQSDFRHIYEIDSSAGLAMVAKSWGEIAVVDLYDGSEIFAGKSPKDVILSSCRLTGNPLRISCRERLEQNKIVIWGLESGESVLTCY